MKNALRYLALVITLIFTINVTALAVTTNTNLQPQSDSITIIQTESQEIERKIELFDIEIESNLAKTEENNIEIVVTEKAIKSAAEEINKVKKEAQKEQELFDKRMRTMYINGFEGYTGIIFNSESFGDFISRVENIRVIIQFDNKVMDEFEAIQDKLNDNQIGLNNKKVALLNLQLENKLELDKMILNKKSQNELITQLIIKEDLLKTNIIESQVSESQELVSNQVQKPVAKITPSRGGVNLPQNSVIPYAYSFIGIPYLWGGTSPSTGFDCSGFTQYVYRHFGISIGRSTTDQVNDGTQVSKNNLQPGDLVFFGSNNNSPQHTGIYVGNNNYIHSPRTGEVIKVSAMTRGDFITGRRVN